MNDGWQKRQVFWVLLGLTLLVFAAISVLDQPLHTTAAPAGIVSFELAGTPARAQAILASWGPRQRVAAALSLGLDYLFLSLYGLTLAWGCWWMAARRRGRVARWGRRLGWGALAAAGVDAVENFALIRLLWGAQDPLWPRLAWGCATVKFTLVVVAVLYLIVALVAARRASPEAA